jgi:hypothetical protein
MRDAQMIKSRVAFALLKVPYTVWLRALRVNRFHKAAILPSFTCCSERNENNIAQTGWVYFG